MKFTTVTRRSALVALVLMVLILAVGVLPQAGCRRGPDRLVLGLVAPSSASGTGSYPEDQTTALADAVRQVLDIKVEVFVFPTSTELIQALSDGQADIAVFGAYAYVAAHQASGAQVLLRASESGRVNTRSQIVVAAGPNTAGQGASGLSATGPDSEGPDSTPTLESLKGKVFGFVDPASPGGYLFPAAYLIQNGILAKADLDKAVFLGNDSAVMAALLEGKTIQAAACADGALFSVRATIPDITQRTVVVSETEPVPLTTLAVRPGLESPLADRIKQAFMAVVADADGRDAWRAITGTDGLVEAQEADYDVIRRMVETMGIDIEVLAG